MTLISHIENTLGEIDLGWSLNQDPSPVQVVRFRNRPFNGVFTYVTLGLSNASLSISQGRNIRQELVFSAYEKFSSEEIASFLLSFCNYVLKHDQALLRGDVVGPSSYLLKGVAVNSVYASIPILFDNNFATYRESSPPTVMVWLIPLLSDEVNFIKSNGWDNFEKILENEDPDLMDLNRCSVVNPSCI